MCTVRLYSIPHLSQKVLQDGVDKTLEAVVVVVCIGSIFVWLSTVSCVLCQPVTLRNILQPFLHPLCLTSLSSVIVQQRSSPRHLIEHHVTQSSELTRLASQPCTYV